MGRNPKEKKVRKIRLVSRKSEVKRRGKEEKSALFRLKLGLKGGEKKKASNRRARTLIELQEGRRKK